MEPWFVGATPQAQVEKALMKAPAGDFVIRESARKLLRMSAMGTVPVMVWTPCLMLRLTRPPEVVDDVDTHHTQHFFSIAHPLTLLMVTLLLGAALYEPPYLCSLSLSHAHSLSLVLSLSLLTNRHPRCLRHDGQADSYDRHSETDLLQAWGVPA